MDLAGLRALPPRRPVEMELAETFMNEIYTKALRMQVKKFIH